MSLYNFCFSFGLSFVLMWFDYFWIDNGFTEEISSDEEETNVTAQAMQSNNGRGEDEGGRWRWLGWRSVGRNCSWFSTPAGPWQ